MRTFGRTMTMLAIVGTVGVTLSGCGWFRGDEDVATTSETTTPATTAERPATVGQMQPVTPAPTTTEQQYQQSLQK